MENMEQITEFIAHMDIVRVQNDAEGRLEILVKIKEKEAIYHCFDGGFTTDTQGIRGNFELKGE